MRIHITLVNPPYPSGSHMHTPFLPLGLGYLAAVLEKNNYQVDVIDCQALKLSYEEVKSEIENRKPTIVGVTSTTLTYKSALKIVGMAKEVCPECLTLIGGSHVTFWDEKALQECPELDIVVRREGENTLLEIIQKIESGKSFDDTIGITCRKKSQIIRNPDRPYIKNLDELPFPAIHLWPIDSFRKYGEIMFPLLTSRGCVYWCKYCSAVRMLGRKYRVRSPKNVVDEIEYLNKKFGATRFTFYDDAFTIDQSRAKEICEQIKNRKMKIRWNCETRVDAVTKELLLTMKEAGCTDVWFGVESGSQVVINAMDKGFNIEQTTKAFKWAKEAGLMTFADTILGFPGESKETAWETIKFVEKLDPDDAAYYIATPYPGTPLYDEVKDNGWLQITDFDKYDTATPTFTNPKLEMNELREIREKAFQRFYLRPKYMFSVFIRARGGAYGPALTRLVLAHLRRAIKAKLSLTRGRYTFR
jgi:anaerobic magnesium-protoporphyrin IX monomethyl ester cyclase